MYREETLDLQGYKLADQRQAPRRLDFGTLVQC